MMKLFDIHIRDPFVLPVASEQCYYLYGTMSAYTWSESAIGFDCYTSTDLENWEGPFPVFRPSNDFWADRNFWAPEVHAYQGRYFMFASFKANGVCRGTQILTSDSPLGPFHPLSDRPVIPLDWQCLDGTLFVAAQGSPWMVFSHEWVQVGDGQVCAIPLSKDLTAATDEPVLLFTASQAAWPMEINSKGRIGYVTDGPFMHCLPDGQLLCLWSSLCPGGYAAGVARTPAGELFGPWQQDVQPHFEKDGGHCMTFRDFEGKTWLSLHHPNDTPDERPLFLPLAEDRLLSPDGIDAKG